MEFSGLTHRPEHAAAMGRIIGISGRLESALGSLLAFLSRGSATITIPMFHAVASTDAQRAMLLAAADHALVGPELAAFHDLMEDFRPRYGERSRLVHNVWGHSNDHPDKALWWRSSDIGSRMAQLAAANSFAELIPQENLSLKAMAYSVKDLEEISARLTEYYGRVEAFITELIMNHPALISATNAATNAPPTSGQPQLDLPPQPQTDP